jgi:hypothetical protein
VLGKVTAWNPWQALLLVPLLGGDLLLDWSDPLRDAHPALAVVRIAVMGLLLLAMQGLGALLVPGRAGRVLHVAVGAIVVVAQLLALAALGLLTPFGKIGFYGLLGIGFAASDWRAPGKSLLPLAPCLLLLLCRLPVALKPPLAWDALVYHLAHPLAYLCGGGLVPIDPEFYAQVGQPIQFILLAAMWLGDGQTAQLLQLALATLLCVELARLLGPDAPPWSRPLPGLLFLIHPVVLWELETAYIDVSLAFFHTVAFGALLERRRDWVVPILLGFTASGKYTLGPICAVMNAVWLWRTGWRAAPLGLLFIVPILPWLGKAYEFTGNPTFPFLQGLWRLPEPLGRDRHVSWMLAFGMGRDPLDFIQLPFRTFGLSTWHPTRFSGPLSIVPLIFLAVTLLLRRGGNALAPALFAAGFLLWGLGSQQTRFLIPLLPIMGLAATPLPSFGPRFSWILAAALTLYGGFHIAKDWYPLARAAHYLTGRMSARDVVRDGHQPLAALEAAPRLVPNGEPIRLVFENRAYYLTIPYRSSATHEADPLVDIALSLGSGATIAEHFRGETWLVNWEILEAYSPERWKSEGGLFLEPEIEQRFTRGVGLLRDCLTAHSTRLFESNGVAIHLIGAAQPSPVNDPTPPIDPSTAP